MDKSSSNLLNRMLVISFVMLTISACSIEKNSQSCSSLSGGSTPRPTGISFTQAAQMIPIAVSSLKAEAIAKGIELKWTGTGEDTINYEVYRTSSGIKNQKLATVKIVGDNR